MYVQHFVQMGSRIRYTYLNNSLLQELDIDVYALRFIPKENGVHYVTVKLKEAHIPGSPFPMLIGKMGADPALVLARGDGLDKGETGTRHDEGVSIFEHLKVDAHAI